MAQVPVQLGIGGGKVSAELADVDLLGGSQLQYIYRANASIYRVWKAFDTFPSQPHERRY
jgi:hypothetical protein